MENIIHNIFQDLPGCYLILLPDAPRFTISDVNDAYLKATRRDRNIIGRGIFEVFPDNPNVPNATGVQNLTASLMNVLNNKRKDQMPVQRYDIVSPDSGAFEQRFWRPLNIPVVDDQQRIACIIHCVEDVTRQAKTSRQLKRRYREMQKQISDAVLTTQEMERMEISRELHDNIIQILNTARIYLDRALKKQSPDEKLTHTGLDLVNKAIDELRKISMALTESSAEEDNLTLLIEDLLTDVFSLQQINIVREVHLPDESLIKPKLKMAVVRIVQEQLSNIVKHSKAKNLWIDLGFRNNTLQLQIRDDGVGFSPDGKPSGLGLQNIRARVAMMNGNMKIRSAPGDGCLIEVNLPL